MGCDIGPITDKDKNERFQEALKIRDQLNYLPTSPFTFGELRFLLEFYEFKHGHDVGKEQLEKLRGLLFKAKHPCC